MARLAYEVDVVNIHFSNRDAVDYGWNRNGSKKDKNGRNDKEPPTHFPTELIVEIPRDFNERFKKRSDADYKDAIESYVYNYLTKRYRKECANCQIWIGEDLEVALRRIDEARRKRDLIGAVDITDRPDDDDDYSEE